MALFQLIGTRELLKRIVPVFEYLSNPRRKLEMEEIFIAIKEALAVTNFPDTEISKSLLNLVKEVESDMETEGYEPSVDTEKAVLQLKNTLEEYMMNDVEAADEAGHEAVDEDDDDNDLIDVLEDDANEEAEEAEIKDELAKLKAVE